MSNATEQRIPNTTQLVYRLHRVAGMVVMCVDRAERRAADPKARTEATDAGAVFALAMWEAITGIDDDAEAVAYARRVANPDWPGWYLSSDNAVTR